MLVNDTRFIIKDGREAILRTPDEKDIPQILQYLVKSSEETDFLIRYPEEINYTYESEKELLCRVNDSDDQAMLICLVENRIAGMCQISFETRIKTRHRASIAIALLEEFWGLGIGTYLISRLIDIAKSNTDIMQVELDYIEGNYRAHRLYEKMGFRVMGIHPNAVRLKDGTMLNEYLMIKTIQR